MTRGKVLILGASGFIGCAIAAKLGDQAVATWSSREVSGWPRFDGTRDRVDILPLDGVTHAVVLMGNTNPDSCARDRAASDQLNVAGVVRALDDLGARGIHCAFASTEVVFDGRQGGYTETDEPSPMLVYGAQKLLVERHLAAHWPNAVSFRIAKVYGARFGDGSLLDGWRNQAQAGDVIRCASDFISSVVHVDDVVDAFLGAGRGNLSGVYHLGGPRPVSRLAMFQALCDAFAQAGHPLPAQGQACSIDDFSTLEGRPKDVSLVSDKLSNALDWRPIDIAEGCARFVRDCLDRM